VQILHEGQVVVDEHVQQSTSGSEQSDKGYIRMTVCTTKERLAEAVERIKKAGF